MNIEVKDRFRGPGALLGQAPPVGIAHASCAIAAYAVAHKGRRDVLICRPVTLEIVEE